MATIESNFESICINPNDDLVLYEKEIVRSRIEKFLYAICSLDTDDLPTPLSRIEELYNCLVTGEDIPTFTPLSRAEKFVMAMLGAYDVELLPTPISRSETLMKKIATGDNNLDDVDNLQSRYEFLLAYIIKAGGFNGGNPDDSRDFYYKLTSLTSGLTTIYDTLNMPVKNAILRGQTLVNLVETVINNGKINNRYARVIELDRDIIKPSTTYTWFIYNDSSAEVSLYMQQWFSYKAFEIPANSLYKLASVTSDTAPTDMRPVCLAVNTLMTVEQNLRVMLVEGDHTNADIPYFTGMQSVKMPVLTTTGKNLFNINDVEEGGTNWSDGTDSTTGMLRVKRDKLIAVKPNTTYVFNKVNWTVVSYYDINEKSLGGYASKTNTVFTTPANCYYLRFRNYNNYGSVKEAWEYLEDLQLEEGSTATSYEPHKSNILTCNEEVELRGIGDIKDELNLLTGELMQRIQERVFDGSENWIIGGTGDNYIMFRCENYTDMVKSSNAITCDKYAYDKLNNATSNLSITNSTTTGKICIVTSQTDLSIDNFKAKLNTDKPTIQYQLAEPIVKTVDLSTLDQDGKETELSTFDDITHVIVSSEGLIPTGDIDIARPIQFVDYSLDNGWTTLYNTIEYPVKSAILKGMTLVNLQPKATREAWGMIINDTQPPKYCAYGGFDKVLPKLKPSTKYLIKFNKVIDDKFYSTYFSQGTPQTGGIIKDYRIVTTNNVITDDETSIHIYNYPEAFSTREEMRDFVLDLHVMIIEYQEGMENWDIPYFEGMASVKMPVLTTVGKNLFDGEFKLSTYSGGKATIPNGNISSVSFPHTTSNNHRGISCILQVKPDTNYTISIVDKQENTVLLGTGYNNLDDISSQAKSVLHVGSADNINHTTLSFTTPSNCNYMIIGCYIKYSYVQSGGTITFKEPPKIQLEENSVSTTYEPHKSNILTCNEEVTLRSNGDICDELNLLTGQLTQRIGEDGVVLSQEVVKTVDLSVVDQTGNVLLITENGEYIITENGDYIKVGTKYKEKETVLSTFDDITHVTVSSEELIPTGEITVATKDATDVIDASVMSLRMDDILNSQGTLEGSANAQSDDIDVVMLGTTDIYEQIL